MRRLIVVFVEAALERVPKGLWRHPSVVGTARRRGKKPGESLLDRTYHHAAMKGLPEAWRRGRPDITHICLLEALGSPLNLEGLLKTYVHTFQGYVVDVNPKVRLPRNYDRFVGLIEQLFKLGRVPPEGEALLRLERKGLRELIEEVSPSYTVALTSGGKPETLEELCRRLVGEERPTVFIGAYPRGPLKPETLRLSDEAVCIDPEVLDAWVVTSRLVYQFELALGLPEERLRRVRRGV